MKKYEKTKMFNSFIRISTNAYCLWRQFEESDSTGG